MLSLSNMPFTKSTLSERGINDLSAPQLLKMCWLSSQKLSALQNISSSLGTHNCYDPDLPAWTVVWSRKCEPPPYSHKPLPCPHTHLFHMRLVNFAILMPRHFQSSSLCTGQKCLKKADRNDCRVLIIFTEAVLRILTLSSIFSSPSVSTVPRSICAGRTHSSSRRLTAP